MAEARAFGRPALAALLGVVLALQAGVGFGRQAPALGQNKATYLYKLALFVEWPPSVFDSSSSPVTICVLGDDALATDLEKVVAGKTRGKRPIRAKRLRRASQEARCQIIYITDTPDQSAPQALQTLEGVPVLTVTEADSPERRGMVNFVFHDNRMRFEIDEAAAARNGVGISAKLLELALTVRRKS